MVQALNGSGNLTTAAVNNGTTLTLDKPANTANGDLLVCATWARSNTAPFTSVPTGWTEVAPVGTEVTSVGILRWYYKQIATASSDPAQYVWSGGATGRNTGVMFRVTGANTSSVVDVVGANAAAINATTSPSLTLPDMTVAGSGDLLLAMTGAAIASGGTRGAFTPPSSMALLGSVGTTTGGSESDLEVDQQILSAPGATGTRVFTKSTAISSGVGYMVAVKNAVTAIASGGNPVATPNPVDAGATCTLTIPQPTGGTGTAYTYAVDWGDGGSTAAQSNRVLTHAYAGVTPGPSDTFATKTITVTIGNA